MSGSTIDLILRARLDLLGQVLDEVRDIRRAMQDQERRLQAIDDFLKPRGGLHQQRVNVLEEVRTAILRIESIAETGADEDAKRALESLLAAAPMVDRLNELRRTVYQEFLGLKEWSVAALDSSQLAAAEKLYSNSLRAIEDSSRPWEKYEEQLRNRGEQLYGAYLELLGSIAVRGLGVVDDLGDLATARQSLLKSLLAPLESTINRPRLSVANLLTRSEHVQLGYLQWSLWALPLIGREAGLHCIREGIFRTPIAEHQQIVCADAYAAYALGPSYVAAVLFLEFDPDGEQSGAAASDPMRADLLLDLLPELASAPQRAAVTSYRDQLRDAWNEARQAIGAPPSGVNPDDFDVTRALLDEVRAEFDHVRYDMKDLSDRAAEAELFWNGQKVTGITTPRGVLVSMWWARLSHPNACKVIDASARAAMPGSPGSSGRAPAPAPVSAPTSAPTWAPTPGREFGKDKA